MFLCANLSWQEVVYELHLSPFGSWQSIINLRRIGGDGTSTILTRAGKIL
jgi:hypothetical protein